MMEDVKKLLVTENGLVDKKDKLVSFGYARISTKDQVTDRQHTAIQEYRKIPECNVFEDVYTGKTFDRDNYQKMKSIIEYQLQVIDKSTSIEVVIKELDRLGRNKEQIMEELKWFKERGVIVRILNIPTTLLDIPADNKWLFEMVHNILIEVYATLAEQEIETRARRQKEGTAEAMAKGVKFGRPAKKYDTKEFNRLYVQWKSGKITARNMMQVLGLTPNTFYRRVHEYEENLKV